jgi:hypothetical protein
MGVSGVVTWRRFWLTLGALVGLGIGVAGLIDGTRGPVVAGLICLSLGICASWWLVASFTDKVPVLEVDGDGVTVVPSSRVSGVLTNFGMLALAFVLVGSEVLLPNGAISAIVTAILATLSAVFTAYAFMGLFRAAKGPPTIELTPNELKMQAALPWRAGWRDMESVGVELFAGKPLLAIRFKPQAYTQKQPKGWWNPPVAPADPFWLNTDDTNADKTQLYAIIIDYWARGQK